MPLTPEPVLRHLILIVLSAYESGSRSRAQVLDDLDEAFHQDWSEEDKASPASDDRKVNWQVRTSFQRAKLVEQGLLTDDADGYWTLTEAGWRAASAAASASAASKPVDQRRLSDITDPGAVQAAIDEFLANGRAAFLAEHSLEPSRDYFVRVDDNLIDSKPILSVAYAYQFPERGRLPVSRFSGGAGSGAAGRTLESLGFEVVTRAQIGPPALGSRFATRSDVQDAYGGDKVPGILRFPGEDVVNVFSDAQGPYADDPPTLTEPFGYRGEGLKGPQKLSQRGNALLERARLSQEPVRFWYRPTGEEFAFLTWVVVLGRAWVSGIGADRIPRPELEWELVAIPSREAGLPATLEEARAEASSAAEDDPTVPEAQASPTYEELLARVEALGQKPKKSGKSRTNYARSAAARRAVLIRSKGMCESTRCTGMPTEVTRAGRPILDVDHIQDLGLGGDDHPTNMAALCPNCHACKTRGANARQWRSELKRVVAKAHRQEVLKP